MTQMTCDVLAQKPGGHVIKNYGEALLAHYYVIPYSVSLHFGKIFLKKSCILHYLTNMAMLYYTRTPAQGVVKFIISIDYSLLIIII